MLLLFLSSLQRNQLQLWLQQCVSSVVIPPCFTIMPLIDSILPILFFYFLSLPVLDPLTVHSPLSLSNAQCGSVRFRFSSHFFCATLNPHTIIQAHTRTHTHTVYRGERSVPSSWVLVPFFSKELVPRMFLPRSYLSSPLLQAFHKSFPPPPFPKHAPVHTHTHTHTYQPKKNPSLVLVK